MNHGPLSLKLTVVLICITSVSSTFSPSGSVSIGCGGQQTFTCTLAGNGPAAWTITGLQGITASGTNGVILTNSNARITSPETTPGANSTITITGFTTADNGGTIRCDDQAVAVEGSATVVVVSTTLSSATAVMATVDRCSATLTWREPSDSSATTSVSCTPPSPQCSSCTSSGCTIGGFTHSTSYTFSVTRSRSGCDDSTALSSAVTTVGLPQCGLAGVVIGNDSCPTFTFTPPQGSVLPSTVVVSYQLAADPSSEASLNCAYPIDPKMCRLVVSGGTYTVRATPQNICGSPSSACSSRTEIIPAACELANSDPISTPTTATAICILSGVIPSVVINIISVVVVFLVTRHCYKKSAKGGSPSRQEELYAQVEGKKVYEDINMTDSPAYGPTSPAPPV